MKKLLNYQLMLLQYVIISLFVTTGCSPKLVPAGSNGGNLDIKDLVKGLGDSLEGRVTGYAFTVHYKGKLASNGDGGMARQSPDGNHRPMSILESYSSASVSKTVSATAMIIALNDNGSVGLGSKIIDYLPSHWTKGSNIGTITFKELLTHNSGFRYGLNNIGDGDDYQTLKQLVARGVVMINKDTSSYNNRNYSLLRLLIPRIAGYSINELPADHTSLQERKQDTSFAQAYKAYCKQRVFDKLLFYTADCKPTAQQNALYYAFGSNTAGIGIGDQTMIAGGQGWIMSTGQMGKFFAQLRYSTDIISKTLSDRMVNELMGYDRSGTSEGVDWYWKNGIYINGNHGYRSLIIGFDNGIQISVMANSTINLQNRVIAAFEDWYH